MIGGLMGDFAGSRYEHTNLKGYHLPLWGAGHKTTDDTILMAATMDALLNKIPFEVAYRTWFRRYPNEGFSPSFSFWGTYDDEPPTESAGNGAAVRATPIGFFAKTEDQVMELAKQSAICSHDSQEAIEGAQAAALAVFYARNRKGLELLRLKEKFGISNCFDLDKLHQEYDPDFICSETVPQAVYIGMKARSFEDAMRQGIFIGGDTDTQMAIAGAIVQARGLPLYKKLVARTVMHLHNAGMHDVIHIAMEFEARCNIHCSFRALQKLTKKMLH